MTRNTIIILAGIVVALALMLYIFQGAGDRPEHGLLVDDLAAQANSIDSVTILPPDTDNGISLRKDGDAWVVGSRFDYPADIGKLGSFVTQLSEARILEEKTSNPDNYSRLAVDDPETGGSGTKVLLSGDGFSHGVIVGNSAQGTNRYVRVPSDATSFLVDRQLEVPASVQNWLRHDLIDIPADRVRKVTISHADGETLALEKSAEEDGNFTVLDIPEGRELSYASAGNSIAGALASLELEDVQQATGSEAATTAVFETWDGLSIEIRIAGEDDTNWLEFAVSGDDPEKLGERLGGWRYRITDYKANLLKRRWDDILKAAS